MADQKLTELTAVTTLADTDIVYLVKDPGGTPLSRKMTVANLRSELMKMPSAGFLYFGDSGTDGTWRIGLDSGALVFQLRVSGSWVEKGAVAA